MLKHLVLFDIDGTLLMPNGAGRAALKIALERVYGTAGKLDSFRMSGSVDQATVHHLMSEAGLAHEAIRERFDQFRQVMEATMRQRLAQGMHNLHPCPGAHELVAALAAHDDTLMGLITGNMRVTAHIKLEAAGFDSALFRVGAYGDEADLREALPPLALERAVGLTGTRFQGQQIVIIGDTPSDVVCGHGVGARSIVVLTGWSTREDLEAAEPDYVFEDLTDTEAVLAAIFAPVAGRR